MEQRIYAAICDGVSCERSAEIVCLVETLGSCLLRGRGKFVVPTHLACVRSLDSSETRSLVAQCNTSMEWVRTPKFLFPIPRHDVMCDMNDDHDDVCSGYKYDIEIDAIPSQMNRKTFPGGLAPLIAGACVNGARGYLTFDMPMLGLHRRVCRLWISEIVDECMSERYARDLDAIIGRATEDEFLCAAALSATPLLSCCTTALQSYLPRRAVSVWRALVGRTNEFGVCEVMAKAARAMGKELVAAEYAARAAVLAGDVDKLLALEGDHTHVAAVALASILSRSDDKATCVSRADVAVSGNSPCNHRGCACVSTKTWNLIIKLAAASKQNAKPALRASLAHSLNGERGLATLVSDGTQPRAVRSLAGQQLARDAPVLGVAASLVLGERLINDAVAHAALATALPKFCRHPVEYPALKNHDGNKALVAALLPRPLLADMTTAALGPKRDAREAIEVCELTLKHVESALGRRRAALEAHMGHPVKLRDATMRCIELWLDSGDWESVNNFLKKSSQSRLPRFQTASALSVIVYDRSLRASIEARLALARCDWIAFNIALPSVEDNFETALLAGDADRRQGYFTRAREHYMTAESFLVSGCCKCSSLTPLSLVDSSKKHIVLEEASRRAEIAWRLGRISTLLGDGTEARLHYGRTLALTDEAGRAVEDKLPPWPLQRAAAHARYRLGDLGRALILARSARLIKLSRNCSRRLAVITRLPLFVLASLGGCARSGNDGDAADPLDAAAWDDQVRAAVLKLGPKMGATNSPSYGQSEAVRNAVTNDSNHYTGVSDITSEPSVVLNRGYRMISTGGALVANNIGVTGPCAFSVRSCAVCVSPTGHIVCCAGNAVRAVANEPYCAPALTSLQVACVSIGNSLDKQWITWNTRGDIMALMTAVTESLTYQASDRQGWWRRRRDLESRLRRIVGNVEALLGTTLRALLNQDYVAQLKVSDLQSKLARLGLSKAGSKSDLAARLARHIPVTGSLALILDETLELLPFESLPSFSQTAATRLPGADLILWDHEPKHHGHKNGKRSGLCVVDPDGNLPVTQRTVANCLCKHTNVEWVSIKPPQACAEALEASVSLFVYCGHGAGERYWKTAATKRNKKLSVAAALLMGCSSGKLERAERYKSPAIDLVRAGCFQVVAILWDVSDRDLDRLTVALLDAWALDTDASPAELLPIARASCKLPLINGAAAVCYGTPGTATR